MPYRLNSSSYPSLLVKAIAVDRKSEQALIHRAKRGDSEAFTELYNAYADKIYHYLYARVSAANIAEDLTGDVFVSVLEGLTAYEDRSVTILAWIYRIAHARLVDYYRSAGKAESYMDIEKVQIGVDDGVDDLLMGRYRAEAVQTAMLSLSADQQQVIMLRFVEGHNLETTAELLGKSVSAIKSLQYRAVQSLGKALQPLNIMVGE